MCLFTLQNIAFFEMWLLNANLNCTGIQNLRECPTFSHCAIGLALLVIIWLWQKKWMLDIEKCSNLFVPIHTKCTRIYLKSQKQKAALTSSRIGGKTTTLQNTKEHRLFCFVFFISLLNLLSRCSLEKP